MYWYGEQQDPKDPIDPRSQDEDLGDDVIKANRYGIQNLKRIVPNIVAWTEAEGQGYLEAGKIIDGGDQSMENVCRTCNCECRRFLYQ